MRAFKTVSVRATREERFPVNPASERARERETERFHACVCVRARVLRRKQRRHHQQRCAFLFGVDGGRELTWSPYIAVSSGF
ncbi:unnamed protein product [Lampetra fluviatilis]